MFDRNIEQLNTIRTVNIHSVAVGLLLKMIIHFKRNQFTLCNGHKMTNRWKVGGMDEDIHFGL
jgi:hypothetical protein